MLDTGSWVLVNVSESDRRRRGHLFLILPFLIVPLTIFAVLNFRVNEPVIGWIQLSMSIMLLISMIGLRYAQHVFPLFRINLALLSMLGVYSTWAGNYQGAAILGLYLYPGILFYFLGKLEGSIWVALVLIPSLFVLFFPESVGAYAYEAPFAIRFAATILLVTLFSYQTQSLRQQALEELILEKESLVRALAEINTLRGIIPICCYCKEIRDDEGMWNQMETYIREHSEADFSHGVCPKCAAKYHPDIEYTQDGKGQSE